MWDEDPWSGETSWCSGVNYSGINEVKIDKKAGRSSEEVLREYEELTREKTLDEKIAACEWDPKELRNLTHEIKEMKAWAQNHLDEVPNYIGDGDLIEGKFKSISKYPEYKMCKRYIGKEGRKKKYKIIIEYHPDIKDWVREIEKEEMKKK